MSHQDSGNVDPANFAELLQRGDVYLGFKYGDGWVEPPQHIWGLLKGTIEVRKFVASIEEAFLDVLDKGKGYDALAALRLGLHRQLGDRAPTIRHVGKGILWLEFVLNKLRHLVRTFGGDRMIGETSVEELLEARLEPPAWRVNLGKDRIKSSYLPARSANPGEVESIYY